MRPMRFALALALSLTPAVALAQNAPAARVAPAPAAPATPAPTANAHQPSAFDAAIARGATAYRDRQFDAAATAFREAVSADARNALPHLYLGFVAQAQGVAATALGSFREAARIAQAQGDDANRARALAAIASLNETQGRWDDARNTWNEYATFADGHPDRTFAAVARARAEVIGRRSTLDTEYAPVRERIAERQRVNASGANQQPPPGTVAVPAPR